MLRPAFLAPPTSTPFGVGAASSMKTVCLTPLSLLSALTPRVDDAAVFIVEIARGRRFFLYSFGLGH
jgi:hypothetical protein